MQILERVCTFQRKKLYPHTFRDLKKLLHAYNNVSNLTVNVERRVKSQLTADDVSRRQRKAVITHRPPRAVHEHLHATLEPGTTRQPDVPP